MTPALHLMLESLARVCTEHAPRTVFTVEVERSRVAAAEARTVAAQLLMQGMAGDVVLEARLLVRVAQVLTPTHPPTHSETALKRKSRSRETALSKTDVMILPSSAP